MEETDSLVVTVYIHALALSLQHSLLLEGILEVEKTEFNSH